MSQPVLRSERLVMVPLADEHLELEVEAFDDPLPGTEQGEVLYEITREDWWRGG